MKKNDLHTLIHTLSKSEKRHFRLQCSRQGTDGNYLRVFDILDRQTVPDEAALRAAFAGEAFARQLHVTKNYLREKILECLRRYHSGMSRDAVVKDHLRNVEILFFKELYDQAADELGRAEGMANAYELHTAQIEVSRWKRKLEQTLHPQRYERFADILKEQELATAALQNNLGFWQMIVQSSRQFMSRSADPGPGKNMPEHPDQAGSLESKVLFYNLWYIRHLQNGRPEQAESSLRELLILLETLPDRVREDPVSYLTTVNNLAGFYVFRSEAPRALDLLQNSRRFLQRLGIPDSRRPVLKQFVRTLNIELEIYRNADRIQPYVDFIRNAETFVRKSALKLPAEYVLSFHFQFAWINLLQKEYAKALDWVSPLLHEWRKFSGLYMFRYLLLLNLMVHCDARNLFVLRYFVENARRYFKKAGDIQPFEQELLHFFSKIGQAPEAEYRGLFRDMKMRLFPEKGPVAVPEEALRMMDLKRWLTR